MSAESQLKTSEIEFQRYHTTLHDGGACYAETDLSNVIVEPWNAFSSLFIIMPAIFWAMRIKGNLKENAFLAYCIPLLFLGGLGSTLFHAFRSSPFLLALDVMPIVLLTASVAAYFWKRLFSSWPIAITIVLISVAARFFVAKSGLFPVHTATNISYIISGVTIFLPGLFIAIRTRFAYIKSLVLSILLFALALLFREMDAWNLPLTMGTHFLWHLSTAVGAFFLANYLFHIRKEDFNLLEIEDAKVTA